MGTVFVNQSVIILLGMSDVFLLKGDNRLEMFNEVMIMIQSYHLFIFSDFVPNDTTRYRMGAVLIALTIFTILVNNIVIIPATVRRILLRIKKPWVQAKEKEHRRKKQAEKLQKKEEQKQKEEAAKKNEEKPLNPLVKAEWERKVESYIAI